MIIYIVTTGSYSDYRIDAAFSTRELAEAHVALLDKCNYSLYADIAEVVVDSLLGATWQERWVVNNWGGNVNAEPRCDKFIYSENSEEEECVDFRKYTHTIQYSLLSSPEIVSYIGAISYVSPEHAMKVARGEQDKIGKPLFIAEGVKASRDIGCGTVKVIFERS